MSSQAGTQPKYFSKTVEVRTSNVAKNIQEIATKEGVHPLSIDFDILRVKSFVKDSEADEYSPMTKEHLVKMYSSDYLLDPNLAILQEYLVKFKPIEPQPFKIKLQISSDKHRSVATAVVKAGSIIKPVKDLKQHLYNHFNKIKLRNNMIIFMLDEQLKMSINRLAELANGEAIKSDFTLILAAWPQAEDSVNDEIIYHYKEKNRQDDDAKQINYADRGFISAVSKGEMLVEYIKPKTGKAGRSFNGKYIPVVEPVVNCYPDFGVDNETIDVVEEGDRKLFVAKDDGYVKLENRALSIDKTMAVEGISLKSTGNIRAGVDKNVKIEVDGKDPSEEVIGSDMIVEASEVRANGSIAGGAKIKAEFISVTGQTHQTSELYAKKIEVNILRGFAKGEDLKIRTLENGRVRGDKVEIEQSVGGEVNGCFVTIGNMRGKTKVTATKSVVIKKVSKGENKISIDPMMNEEFAEQINKIHKEVEKHKALIENIKKSMEQNTNYLAKNQDGFRQIQHKIAEDKKEGRPPSEAFMRMAKEFIAAQKKNDVFNLQIEQLELEIDRKHKEIEQFDRMVLEAVVVNESVNWVGFNEVRFRLPVLDKEYVLNIVEGDRILRVRLDENSSGEYEIMAVHG